MKLAGDHGRVWPCSVLKLMFKTMASMKDSSLTPLLHGDCCPTSYSISWRLWIFFLHGNGKCKSDPWWIWCYFTTSYYCVHRHFTKFICTAIQWRQPCCFTYSCWRVDAICLQTFLVLTDKRGRSVWVDSLQAGSYGRLHYILPRAYNSCFWNIWFFEL